ncbi:Acetyl-CoA carboxylase, biotin carboxyl carrier protein [Oenococcus oeni]|uniref:acetyl-CoA carboxylase biotin carboxyl carrier protein n=1 Tax=Oenococcus oeni TaxID=1247 RepID=UPI00107D4EA4|nr:acetyl-CoA carboxylase biotin carboxyl carrier protein [Oenococcus oeni]AVI94738.1 acetyl-CoA carboxylase biotin carboxyl carrier protein subunit [Oenococcus oeni]SYV98815.1 Acetyl-CoA carboxylase, biotin carboxyl carrier protein [Oenococcus oeni]SYV99171.1 Acetyl-CoA carboxylase, biotin carboxyl carrier protein [Oenococcus oeni]SYW18057.1 Acetyl-CoA carboxylase, biotin carboxyl carrier protein [Oenococcus oeni]VDC15348.1 Acetyl-CoA carboxylase, biotin carboxyl carrier protein [Oenococcus o
MDEKTIKDLIEQINQSSIREFDLTVDGVRLYLSKNKNNRESSTSKTADKPASSAQFPLDSNNSDSNDEVSEADKGKAKAKAKQQEDENTSTINSPLVGVAYLQANPDAEPYVKVGDQVKAGDVVCVIEAMKMMTEIKSSVNGTVAEILIDNESMVDYDQPLIKVHTEAKK